ncbi:MAG: AAA family ATPase [Prevotella sp.]|nr:AAA family ATPase [Prevotella sp.]
MNSLRLRNYRCFEDTGDIQLKPITLLVGANSSGKSSFLKFFPLLKQSIGIKKNGVFLWYSDDVDFKDFKNTVKDGEGSITIAIEIPLADRINNRESTTISDFFKSKNINYQGATTYLELTISEIDKNTDYLEHLSLSYFDQKIDVSFSKEEQVSIRINDDVYDEVAHCDLQLSNAVLPRIIFTSHDDGFVFGNRNIRKMIIDFFKASNNSIDVTLNDILFRSFYFLEKDLFKEFITTVLKKGKNAKIDINKLNNLYILYNLTDIIELVNSYFYSVAMNISYVKPLRVMPERYYRYQNYSVDEISSDGKNLAMYFANLKRDELKKFQKWTLDYFGFELELHKLEGHVEIEIKEKGKKSRNMIDTGFGYNQLLPILAIIWNALNNRRKKFYHPYIIHETKFIVIEQPELHLHPRILTMFAEVLCNIASNSNKKDTDIRFIIETHSETIINKIGSLIMSEKANENDVNLVLFNAKNEGLNNYVEQATFDEKGYLNNWPIGFFL